MSRPQIVIIGAGFAGHSAAKTLSRLARGAAEIVLVNPTDYFLYFPLLPEVATGLLDPRRVTVPLMSTLRGARLVLGEAREISLDQRRVGYVDPEGRPGTVDYDRLIVAAGSVNKLLPVPGVAEHAHGFRGVPEALYLRDHLIRQIELADATDEREERDARCTFVVVGAGYTGTEVTAHGALFTRDLARGHPRLRMQPLRWLLVDVAARVLPELDEQLSRAADGVLRHRGVEVRVGTSVKEATSQGVWLTSGEYVATRTLVWCVGVRPDSLVANIGLPTVKGRLIVDEYLGVPGHPEVLGCGDAAAVPDLTRPGELTAMTAQHASRQGRLAAHNVAASFGRGRRRAYRHHDLGFLVDLGGVQAAANPLQIPVSGPGAKLLTRAYHLLAMRGNRIRTASDWVLNAVLPRRPAVQLGLVRSPVVPLESDSPELPRLPR